MQTLFNKTIKSLLCISSLVGIVGITGCSHSEPTSHKVVTCAPKSDKTGTDTYEYVLDEDGKTVKYFTAREHVGMSYYKYILGTDDPDMQEVANMYAQYYNDYKKQYDAWMTKNSHVSWIKANLTTTDEAEVTLTITFDFTDENFQTNKKTLKFLNAFMPADKFYNEDEQKLEYKAGYVEAGYQEYSFDLTCSTKTKDTDSTLHSQLLEKLEKINNDSN